MVQVSKRFIKKEVQDKIMELFASSIVHCRSKEEALSLIEDLLTPTEKVMLSKRFSIAYMLLHNYDYSTISATLKVSYATIGSVSSWLKTKGNGFRRLIEKVNKEEKLSQLWKDVKTGIVETVASSYGVNWKRSKKAAYEYKRSLEEPF